MITPEELDQLAEMRRLLDEAYDHYFATGDGYCKSGDGHISLRFGTYFERTRAEVEIYSSIYGPHRTNDFDSISEALAAVRKWHAAEMAEVKS